MKKILLLLIIVGIYPGINAQVVVVKDKESGQALELVNITSAEPKAFSVTNSAGQADIHKFVNSKEIVLQLLGFKTERKTYSEIEESNFKIFLEPSNISLDQVIVSATKWNQAQKDIPAKIATINPRDVILQNPQTAADMLGSSGEVFIQKSQQGGGSPMIRGFATNRVLIAVDGVRMNTAIFRSGNLQNVISLDPFAVERTEVLFGPGSVIYGSDAIGGVMSFYTLSPQFSLNETPFIKGSAIIRQSSANNENTGHADINVGWKKFALTTSISYNDYGHLKMGSNGPDDYLRNEYVQRVDGVDKIFKNTDPLVQRPTMYSQINLLQKFRYKPDEDWELDYGFYYSTTTNYDRYDRHIRFRNGLPRSGEWYYGPQKWMMNTFDIENHKTSGIYDDFIVRLAHQYFEESRIDRDFNKPDLHSRIEKVNAYSINLDFTKKIDNLHQINYGAELVYNDINSAGTDEDIITGIIAEGPSRYPQSTWASYAAYATYQFTASENLTFHAGARYNYFELDADFNLKFYPFPFSKAELNEGALTGSLCLVYRLEESWSLSANLSTGFRSPNVDDVGKVFDSEPGSVVVPNPGLKSEYAYNAEIGIAKVFDDFMKIDFTGYYTVLEDAMVRRDFKLNGLDSINYDGQLSQVQAIQNAAEANVWGIQAGVEIKLPNGFGFSTRVNFQDGEEELDDGSKSSLRHAGPFFGTIHLTYTVQKLKLDLYAIYNGEISYEDLAEEEKGKNYLYAADANGNPYSPSWYTLNLKAIYQITNVFSLSAGVENLTDQRYRPYSSGIAAAGRNFIMAVRAGW